MKKGIGVVFLILFVLSMGIWSCAGTSPASKAPEKAEEKPGTLVFLHVNGAAEYHDISAIAIEKWKTAGIASYSVDRYEAKASSLIVLEIGTFVITGKKIRIVAGDYDLEGTINDTEIVIGGMVYTLQ